MNSRSKDGMSRDQFMIYTYESDRYMNHKQLSNIYFNISDSVVLENIQTKEKISLNYLEWTSFKMFLTRLVKIAAGKGEVNPWNNENVLRLEVVRKYKEKITLEISKPNYGSITVMPATLEPRPESSNSKLCKGIEIKFGESELNRIYFDLPDTILLLNAIKEIDIKNYALNLVALYFNNQELFKKELPKEEIDFIEKGMDENGESRFAQKQKIEREEAAAKRRKKKKDKGD